jgi:hypothetical protein
MEAVRGKWTDERLDDLNVKVDGGFRRMDERFAGVDSRIDGLQRSMLHGLIAVVGVQITLFAALVALLVALR